MTRITQSDLDYLVAEINRERGTPEPNHNTPLSYHLQYAYGGGKLTQVSENGHGHRDISTGGYGTKRELYNFMRGMVA